MADGRWQKKEKTSGKKGVIKADLVSTLFCYFRIRITIFVGAKHSCHKLSTKSKSVIQECFAQSLSPKVTKDGSI